MLRPLLVCFLALAMAAPACAQPSPLRLEAKIPLGNVAGRIDHMAFAVARNLLFVAELGNNSLGVVDVNARKVIHRITRLKEPQGVAYLASRDLLHIANGGDGAVRVYRGSDFSPAAVIPLGSDADNVRFDPAANRIVVGYGKGALAIIDPAGGAKVADIPLKAHPESFQLDPGSDRIFVNLPEARSIAVVSKTSGQAVANWPQTHGGNYAMTLDNEKQRVFVVFRNPAKFVALAKDNGVLVAEADTCGDADDLFFDAKRQRVYIAAGRASSTCSMRAIPASRAWRGSRPLPARARRCSFPTRIACIWPCVRKAGRGPRSGSIGRLTDGGRIRKDAPCPASINPASSSRSRSRC